MVLDLLNAKEFENLVRSFPDFGFHGTEEKTLDEIMAKQKFFAHFLFVGEKERQLPVDIYWGRLKESVLLCLNHGTDCRYDIKNLNVEYVTYPGILLLEPRSQFLLGTTKERDDLGVMGYQAINDRRYGTFPWGKDLITCENTQFYPIKFDDKDASMINDRLNEKGQEVFKSEVPELYMAYFVTREMTSLMVNRLLDKCKEIFYKVEHRKA